MATVFSERLRRFYRRPSVRATALFATAVLATAAAFFGAMLQYTRGNLSPPLDDTLIYFQYARQIAHGHVFVFIDGDPATGGSTSFLYPFVLAGGYLAGFRDDRLVLFAFALATALLSLIVALTYAVARRIVDPVPAGTAALLVAVNGWLAWTFFSMMEAGLHAAALLLTLWLFTRAASSRRDLGFFCAMLAILPFVRPELSLVSFAIAAYAAFSQSIGDADRSAWRLRLAPVICAIAGVLLYFALMTALTGSPRTDTYVVQSVIAAPQTTWAEKLTTVTRNFGEHLTFAFTFFGPAYISLAAAMLALIGGASLVADDLRAGRATVRALIPLLFTGGVLSASLEHSATIHFHRWAAPYEPLAVLLVVYGLTVLIDALPNARRFSLPVAGALVASAIIPAIGAANTFGQNTADIYFQQTAAGRWLASDTTPDTVVAIGDAGAIPYYSHRRVDDLIGLVTKGNAEAYVAGQASVYERIEDLPQGDRPTVYAIYPTWFDGITSPELGFLRQDRVFALDRRTIAGSAVKVIYRPDNSLLGSGDAPGEIPTEARGWHVVDRLDVADVASERSHGYGYRQREVDVTAQQVLLARGYGADQQRVIDGGRANFSEHLDLKARAGRPFVVLFRTTSDISTPTGITNALFVSGNGAPGELDLPAAADAWRDVVVARGDDAPAEVHLSLRTADGSARFASFSYWLLQPD